MSEPTLDTASSRKLHEIVRQTSQIILEFDHQGNILKVDGQKTPSGVFPNFFSTLNEYETDDFDRQAAMLNQDPTHHRSITITTIRDDSAVKWSLVPVYDPRRRQYRYSAVGLEIDKEFYQSSHDSLTGLYNRSFLNNYLTRLNSSRHLVAVFFFDADNLKKINDVLGHDQGDLYLKNIANFILKLFRPDDTFGRWGGDEFLAVLEGVDADTAQLINQRIQISIDTYNQAHPDNRLDFSHGFAVKELGQNIFDTVRQADANMYQHKAARKQVLAQN